MNSFVVFFQKEWMELIRTKKLYVLMGIFAFFGMLSPVIARYMAEIVAIAAGDMLSIDIPPTTWADSWAQFYSNLSQMGGICVIFMFMSCVSGEKQSGSAALTLTKNLSHTSFLIAKFAAAAIVFMISLFTAGALCYGYTYYLYGYAGALGDIVMGIAAYSVFTIVLLGVTVLASTIARSTAIVAVLSFCGFIILSISSYLPGIGQILPGNLLSKTAELSAGVLSNGIVWIFATSLCLTGLLLFLSVHILERQEI